jgi:ribosomal protein S18 acetylase RimI-like enzyme
MIDDLTVRLARPDDALCLGVLSTQVFLDTYARQGINAAVAGEALRLHSVGAYQSLLANPGVTVLVAERGGNLIGFSQVAHGRGDPRVPHFAAAELCRLYVQEGFTGRGLGRDLLRQTEKAAIARGAEMLWLKAWAGNGRALSFYPRCGYDELGDTVYTIDGVDYPNKVSGKRVRHMAPAS